MYNDWCGVGLNRKFKIYQDMLRLNIKILMKKHMKKSIVYFILIFVVIGGLSAYIITRNKDKQEDKKHQGRPFNVFFDQLKKIHLLGNQGNCKQNGGTQQRSEMSFIKAIALIRDGRIGALKKATCAVAPPNTP